MLIKPLEQSNHFGGGGTVFDGLCRILVDLFLSHADMDVAESKFSHILLYSLGFTAKLEKEFAGIVVALSKRQLQQFCIRKGLFAFKEF